MSQKVAETSVPDAKRSFVFLQGPTSTVFRDLGRALAARGHAVCKINLCPGDMLFWQGSEALRYFGTLEDWPGFLERILTERRATDIVYFADRFPYHKAAQVVARARGVRCVSMEYGYLRPDWLILEEGGQSTYSHFPSDPDEIMRRAAFLPAVDAKQRYSFSQTTEALCEAVFHLSNAFAGWLLTPKYTPDRYYPVLREFPAYIPRFIRRARNTKRAARAVADLTKSNGKAFLVPLQMQNDFQLRDNAPEGYQRGFIAEVMESFRAANLNDAQLVFKLHPLDNGLERWDRVVPEMAENYGITDRVKFLDGGDLDALFGAVSGVIVINSTMGLRALQRGLPTCVRGMAVYDIQGLTHQGGLDAFWKSAIPPDPELLDAFLRALAHGIHVRGTVYGTRGKAAFVKAAVARLEAPELHGAGLYVEEPPRLKSANERGIRVAWPSPASQFETSV